MSAATDVVFGFGDPIEEVIDLNFQSGPDAMLAARLHLYNAACHLRFAVPVRSVAILLRRKADARDLTGNLSYASAGRRVQFEFEVVRLWEKPAARFLEGGIGLLPLAPLCELPEGKPLVAALREVIGVVDQRLAQERNHAEAVRLMTATFILTGLRVDKNELASIFDGVKVMHESSAYELLEEWEKKGEKKAQLRLLLRLGRKRLGVPDPRVEAALAVIEDTDRLDRMAEATLTAASWQELLDTP
ncbi:MAG: hypothetical protein U0793_21375 [Gemmataceae bacterium]